MRPSDSSGRSDSACSKVAARAASGDEVVAADIVAAARQVETPQFKQWFGESKVVDEAGAPLVVYHGTIRQFDSFDVGAERSIQADPNAEGLYFTRHAEDAGNYAASRTGEQDGANVLPVYVSLKKPFIWPDDGLPPALISKAQRADLEAAGHDGIIFRGGDEVVAFRPSQVKSAIGNSGRFDPNSASLTDTALEAVAQTMPATREDALRASVGQAVSGSPIEVRPIFDRSPATAREAATRLSDPDARELADASSVQRADAVIAQGESADIATIEAQAKALDAEIRAMTEEAAAMNDEAGMAMKEVIDEVNASVAEVETLARESIKHSRILATCAARFA